MLFTTGDQTEPECGASSLDGPKYKTELKVGLLGLDVPYVMALGQNMVVKRLHMAFTDIYLFICPFRFFT